MSGKFSKIVVMGLGYVGLPTAAVLASRGLDVLGVDISRDTVELINKGQIHIEEPDLDIMVQGAVAAGRLRAANQPEPADAFIVAVPTPFKDDHVPDLSSIQDAAAMIAPVLKKGATVILESTVPVGTTEKLSGWLAESRGDLSFPHQKAGGADIFVAHSPERVLPGRVLLELVDNDRVVGGLTPHCAERATALYRHFVQGACHQTDARTAELTKLTENAFRDVNIAFANELSQVCEKLGVNVWDVVELANRHPRVNILNPGPGVGGHCIAVDPWFIVSSAPDESNLIKTARVINDTKPLTVVRQVLQAAAAVKKPRIACLGLSYKADIDDLRESPAVQIVAALAETDGGDCLVVEPHVETLPKALSSFSNVSLVSLGDALKHADVIVLLVDHTEFKNLDRTLLKDKAVIDTRGVWR